MSEMSDLFVRALNLSRQHVLYSMKRASKEELKALGQKRIDEFKHFITQELLTYAKTAIGFKTVEQAKTGDTNITGTLVVITEEEMKVLVGKVFDLGYQEGAKENAKK